jgi:hypothetical protein
MKSVEWIVLALFLALLWLRVRGRRHRQHAVHPEAEKAGGGQLPDAEK